MTRVSARGNLNRLLSILLAAVLVFSVFTILPLTASAEEADVADVAADEEIAEVGIPEGTIPGTTGTGLPANPIVADTFAELKAALEYNAELYIKVNSFQNTTGLSYYGLRAGVDYSAGDCAINEKNTKHLTLNANINIRANDTSTLLYSLIGVTGSVDIQGTGSLNVSFNSSGYPNAIFMVYSPGSLTVNNITLNPTPTSFSIHGVSIYNYTGTVTINNGEFKGTGHNYGSGNSNEGFAVINDRGTMTIYNGTFEATGGTKNYGLYVGSNAKSTVLTGGVYTGIRTASGKLSALVPAGYVFKNVPTGITFDGTTVSSYTDQVQVINGNAVYNIDVNVTAPADGKTSTAPTLTGTDAALHQYTWEDLDAVGSPGTSVKFVAGHQYKLTMLVYPAQGKVIPEPEDLAITVNGDKNVVRSSTVPGARPVGYTNFSYYFVCPISTVNLTLDLSQPNADATVDNSTITVTQTQWNKTSEDGDYKIYCRIESSENAFQEDTTVYINDTYLTQIEFCSESVIVCSAEISTGVGAVSGKVTSFLDEDEWINVDLYDANTREYIGGDSSVKGNDTEYSIQGVPAGSYILLVSKPNHVDHEYSITVSGNKTQDVVICPVGDISGDGKVTTKDYAMANAHAQKVSLLTDEYQIKCGDVLKSDGKITTADAARINAAAQKVDPLW